WYTYAGRVPVMHESKKQFMLGLPGAGKTTYLAALWHVIESEDVDSALRLAHLHGEHGYLNSIRGKWLDVQHLDRTKTHDQNIVRMLLTDPVAKVSTEVVIP